MKRRAFTLTEVVVSILLLGVLAAALTLSPNASKLTGKMEAERIVTQLYRFIETANKTNVSFKVLFDGEEQTESVTVEWQTPTTSQSFHKGQDKLTLSKGCSIKNRYGENASNNMNSLGTENFYLVYNLGDTGFPKGMTLQVKGQDNSIYFIRIYSPGTRIRTSDTESDTES